MVVLPEVVVCKGGGHPVLAQSGGGGNSSNPFATSALEGSGWLAPSSGCFTPDKDPVPIVWEAGWARGLVWTDP